MGARLSNCKYFASFDVRVMEIFSFSIRFNKTIHDLSGTGMTLQPTMIFLRATQSLQMEEHRILYALVALSDSQSPQCPGLLRQVTHRLLPRPLKAGGNILRKR